MDPKKSLADRMVMPLILLAIASWGELRAAVWRTEAHSADTDKRVERIERLIDAHATMAQKDD